MFENLCTLPLTSELFTQSLHPTEPILAVGLSGGHVHCFRLPAVEDENVDEGVDADGDADTSVLSVGIGTIDTVWRTRRHKGSCRTLGFSLDGEVLYSAGTDSLLKAASSATGQVTSKILLPFTKTNTPDTPTLLHALSPQTLLLATDSCALHLYDLRDVSSFKSGKPAQTHYPHEDYISSLAALPPTEMSTSGYSKQWVTTGGTTLAVTDLRRGVLVKSEDQEEELLSCVFVRGLEGRGKRREKVCVGNGNGVVTLWEKGGWDDQEERIIVDGGGKAGGESLDSMVVVPEGLEGGYGGKCVVVGCGDGSVRVVRVGGRKGVVEDLKHDDIEAVVAVGFDVGGRLISGGGETVKVWQEKLEYEEDEEEDEDEDGEDRDDDVIGGSGKRSFDKDSDDSDARVDSSDEEDGGRKKRKKKRGKKGQVGNGILGFKGME